MVSLKKFMQNKLCCTVLNLLQSTCLFRRQTDYGCSNRGWRLSKQQQILQKLFCERSGWMNAKYLNTRKGARQMLFHPAWRVWSVLAPRYFREALKGMLLPQALAESLRTKECQFEWGNTKYANLGVRAFYIKQQNNL